MLVLGTSFSGTRVSKERFRFLGDESKGIDELGGYAIGEDRSGMLVGGDDGNARSAAVELTGVDSLCVEVRFLRGVSTGFSPSCGTIAHSLYQ